MVIPLHIDLYGIVSGKILRFFKKSSALLLVDIA